MKVIYLHGFGSVGTSAKSDALKERFGAENVIAPDLPLDPDEVIKTIDGLIRELDLKKDFPIVFAGTSLGGFWANYMSMLWDAPCVIANPATRPSKTMFERMNGDLPSYNYSTGEIINILPKYIREFKQIEGYISKQMNGKLIHLYLAKDDEVLDYRNALEDIPFSCTRMIKEDGGHRFEKYWPEIIERIDDLTFRS